MLHPSYGELFRCKRVKDRLLVDIPSRYPLPDGRGSDRRTVPEPLPAPWRSRLGSTNCSRAVIRSLTAAARIDEVW